MAVSNKDTLEEIAHEIITNLSQRCWDALLLLAHLVFSEHYNVKVESRQFKNICDKLDLSSRDGSNFLSREISLNGQIYQTRHEIISGLFYQELFSEKGILKTEDINTILTNLLEFHLEKYQLSYGIRRHDAANSIMKLSAGLVYVDLDTQQYLLNRVLDEIKSQPPKVFHELPFYIKDKRVQLLFYRICFDREWFTSAFLWDWCHLLLEDGMPWMSCERYSPAWIMKEACINHGAGSSVWNQWAQLETLYGNIGDYNSEYTARWLYRKICFGQGIDIDIAWHAWGKLEEEQGNIGDYEEENSARWIYRRACVDQKAGNSIWYAWGKLEEKQGNIGDYEEENSARWIYRKACIDEKAGDDVWQVWGKMEEGQGNIGDYGEENSARWIYRKACIDEKAGDDVWQAWGKMEEGQGNIGDYGEENSARWIYRKVCIDKEGDASVWQAWGRLEEGQGNIGDYGEENSARWIYRKVCIDKEGDIGVWQDWGKIEEEQGDIGDCGKENSARWIYTEGIRRFPNEISLYSAFADMEIFEYCASQARMILRKCLECSDIYIGKLAILEFYYGNIDSEDVFCMKKLMLKMESRQKYSLKELYYLYYCYSLLGRTEDAERCYEYLEQYPTYDILNKDVKSFVNQCEKAVTLELAGN